MKDLNRSRVVAISTWTSARAGDFSKCRFASLHLQKNRGSMSQRELAFYNNNSCSNEEKEERKDVTKLYFLLCNDPQNHVCNHNKSNKQTCQIMYQRLTGDAQIV